MFRSTLLAAAALSALLIAAPSRAAELMTVPEGWTVKTLNTTVSAAGPQGQAELGLWMPVFTPAAAAARKVRPALVAEYTEPFQALASVWTQLKAIKSGNDLTLVGRTSIEDWIAGKGELLHLRANVQGRECEYLAMVLMAPTGFGEWMLSYSVIGCESREFSRNLPTLLKVWSNYYGEDRVQKARLSKALTGLSTVETMIGATARVATAK